MLKTKIEYVNYNDKIHSEFPRILSCKVYEKNEIINIDLDCSNIITDINDDICYDNTGKYIHICVGQWHNIETGKYISEGDFFDLDEFSTYEYEYVEAIIKVYSKDQYRVYYHNYMDRKIKISLIPSKNLDFNCLNCMKKIFEYKS